MAIEVKLPKPPKAKPYPKLMVGISTGNIALFKDAEIATYLAINTNSKLDIGSTVITTGKHCWKDYTGEITLSNK